MLTRGLLTSRAFITAFLLFFWYAVSREGDPEDTESRKRQ